MGIFCKKEQKKTKTRRRKMTVNAQKGDVSQRNFSEANRRCIFTVGKTVSSAQFGAVLRERFEASASASASYYTPLFPRLAD
jgi:hypothetical protein